MIIAVEGCAHGELETIYDTIHHLEEQKDFKVDVLICCGDFQSSRNEEDLLCMAVPLKYCRMCTFYKYYSGEKQAPVLTIFVGGNHEASNYLQELPYGGWVAPNIYYLGYGNVINVGGVRIGGVSGIYKGHDYLKGHFEKPPYNENTKRSVYHLRNLEVFRMKQVSGSVNVFLSHGWPTGVCEFGNQEQLMRFKPYFKADIESGKLGSKPCEELLYHLKPDYWFAAHLHCKFAALIPHENEKTTKFLALDKCLPRRRFLQILDIPHDASSKLEIAYDLEWLTILYLTNHLLNTKNTTTYMPGAGGSERWKFTPTEDEKQLVLSKFENDLRVPINFAKTAPVYDTENPRKLNSVRQPKVVLNPQTKTFCARLGVDDPIALLVRETVDDEGGSFLEDSYAESGGPSFVADTDVSVSEESFSIATPLKKMSLPAPKMGGDEVSFTEEDEKEGEGREFDDSGCAKLDESASSIREGGDVESPRPKKFVRRNADIYKADNDL